jgi:hypothetical protein
MWKLVTIAMLFSPGSTALGHHSVWGTYDQANRITIEVVVEEFHFVNPHPLIEVKAVDESMIPIADHIDSTAILTLEMDNRWELVELGFTEDTLAPGDRIIVTVDPSRQRPNSLYLQMLEHVSDGYRYEHNKRSLFYQF